MYFINVNCAKNKRDSILLLIAINTILPRMLDLEFLLFRFNKYW